MGERRLSGMLYLAIVLVVITNCFTSCISTKKVTYFSNLPDTILTTNPITVESPKFVDPVILPFDNLLINIQTSDQNETNTPTAVQGTATLNPFSGYLVDKNGMVDLALIGFVKVGGLTSHEASELVKEKAKEFYKEPVARVRIMNFDVSILGEVKTPGTFNFPAEKVNVMEAIAMAGDLPLTARRNDILLVRTVGDTRKFVRLNLNSTEVFQSPYFYLRQRDILYVKPTKYRAQSSDNQITRNISIVSSIVSLGLIFLAFRNIK